MHNIGSCFVHILGSFIGYIFAPIDNFINNLPIIDFAKDALIDSMHMVPFLLVIFFIIESLEHFFADRINEKVKAAEKAGPLVGSMLACIPQCGFSVVASMLYTRKLLTMGTLLAVYLSTSDEAIPVMLAMPNKVDFVMQLLLTKLIIAIIAGYTVDFVMKRCSSSKPELLCNKQNISPAPVINKLELANNSEGSVATIVQPEVNQSEDHNFESSAEGCCGHHVNSVKNHLEFFIHPVTHTAKVTFFVFLVTLIINFIIFKIGGEENLGSIMLQHSVLQPVITAFVGLIPNCAASVAITLMYLKGGISFGSLISGLCASAGLGLLILFRENNNLKDTLKVLGWLLVISIISGIICQIIFS